MTRHKVRPCPLCREEKPLPAQELRHACSREVNNLRGGTWASLEKEGL
jgi:hypothetical protein